MSTKEGKKKKRKGEGERRKKEKGGRKGVCVDLFNYN